MKKRLLNIVDWNNIETMMTTASSNISSLLSRMTAVESSSGSVSSLLSRMTTAEGSITSLLSRMGTAEGSITSLLSRMTSAEGTLGTHTTDINALKAWRAAKATASPDVATNFSVATDVITLGLAAPRASSINAIINTIMGEVNGIKAILRSREILAT